jgi:predicted amidohydrolase
MKNQLSIGFFQYTPIFNDIKRNLDSIHKLIKDNKKAIADKDIIIFPEYSFSGPINVENLKNYKNQLKELDINNELKKISKKYPSTAFVFGSIITEIKKKYYNTTFTIKNGDILSQYSKKALIYNENIICEVDSNFPVIKIKNSRIGIAICWDLILPEVFRKYSGKVDLMIVPSFWGIGGNELQAKYSYSLEKKYYEALCVARAYENSFNLLFVNSVGKYKSDFYSDRMMGGSLLVTPPAGVVYKTNNKNPSHLHNISLDSSLLIEYRKYYATDKDYEYYMSKGIF